MKQKLVKLNKNATLAYRKNDLNEISLIDIMFDGGAMCDTIPGLAHFTEHMFFTGTDELTKKEITKKYYDFIGVNAYTKYRSISFVGEVFTKELKDYVSTVAMMINDSKFDKEAVDKEIKVVQQEIANKKDNFRLKAELFNEYNLKEDKVFKNTILGLSESVAKIKSKDVKNFVDNYFVANNARITVVSPYSLNKVKKILNKNLICKLNINKELQPMEYFCFDVKNDSFFKIETNDINKTYVYINFTFNSSVFNHLLNNKYYMICDIVNDISDGIMKTIRLEKSLVYSGYFGIDHTKDKAVLTFRTECDKENVNEILKEVSNYIKNAISNGFTANQLEKVNRLFDHDEDARDLNVKRYINQLFQFKRYGKILNKKLLKKDRLNTKIETLNEIFKDIFTKANVSLSLYGDVTKKDVMSKQKFQKLYNFKDL